MRLSPIRSRTCASRRLMTQLFVSTSEEELFQLHEYVLSLSGAQ